MKIGICVRAIQVDGNSSTAFTLARALLDMGHAVTLLSPMVGPADDQAVDRRWRVVDIGQRLWESEAGLVARLGRTFAAEGFDVLMVLTGLPIPMLEESYSLLWETTALVPIVLGDREHVYDPLARSVRFWNVALTISPGLQREVERRLPGRPVRMLTHTIDFPDPVDVAQRTVPGGTLRLLSVGRLFGTKNVLDMPPILAECDRRGVRVELTVFGDGPDRRPLEDAARQLGVGDRLTFRGFQRQSDLYRAMREHDVLLFTSVREGLGLVLLEAQANGCVPVATRLPGISDYAVEDGVTGLLAPPGDATAFAERIVSLSAVERWKAMSDAGIERMRRLFHPGIMAGELRALLEGIRDGEFPTMERRAMSPLPAFGLRARLPRAFHRVLERVGRSGPARNRS